MKFESIRWPYAAAAAAGLMFCVAHAADPVNPALITVNKSYLLTVDEALQWNQFKSEGGPNYAGSPAGVRFGNYIIAQAQELGLVDLDFVDIPYKRYEVNDWPDRRTHTYGSGVEILKLVSDGVGVPVVASYGMTSGFTPDSGTTAQMIYYDPANPPTDAQIAGKILVAKTVGYPTPVPNSNGPYAYSSGTLGSYAQTDSIYRSPGKWPDPFKPTLKSQSSAKWGRYTWSQVGTYATIGIRAHAAGIVLVYDLSPGMALGMTQRSVYAASGSGANTVYANVPTLTLDRVNGARVLVDAQAGKTATLTLKASFVDSHGKAILGYLPGKDYGTAADNQILIATHQDAMALVEDNGSLGMLGVLKYFKNIPQAQRPRTLVFYWDNRHFMPGGEGSWDAYAYYTIHPEKKAPIIAAVGMEHMAARTTIETGPGGNDYQYSPFPAKDGGVITGYIRLDNNEWMIKQIKRAINDNGWVRAEAKNQALPGSYYGGYQSGVNSPLTISSTIGPDIPGLGLAGDWPGAATQTYAQLYSEATPLTEISIDPENFVQEVGGFSQMIGNMMLVDPIVIDNKWGRIRAGLACTQASFCSTPTSGFLPDSKFVNPATAPATRQALINQYLAMTDLLEQGNYNAVRTALTQLQADITTFIAEPNRTALNLVITTQVAKLPAAKAKAKVVSAK